MVYIEQKIFASMELRSDILLPLLLVDIQGAIGSYDMLVCLSPIFIPIVSVMVKSWSGSRFWTTFTETRHLAQGIRILVPWWMQDVSLVSALSQQYNPTEREQVPVISSFHAVEIALGLQQINFSSSICYTLWSIFIFQNFPKAPDGSGT